MKKQLQKFLVVLVVISLLTMPATVSVEAAATTVIGTTNDTGKLYVFQNVHSGKFLEVADGDLTAGANVWQDTFEYNSNMAQVFRLLSASDDDMPEGAGGSQYYCLRPASSFSIYLDVDNANDLNGTNIKVHTYNPGYGAQSFRFCSNGDGSYRIEPYLSRDSGRVLTVANASGSNKANVVLSAYTGDSSQKWVVKELCLYEDEEFINLNWGYFFKGEASTSFRRISRRIIKSSSGNITHAGIDLPADQGTAIYSPCAGRVQQATFYGDMGYYVIIESTATITVGSTQKKLTMRLLHMDSAPKVSAGQLITKGALLGYVGSTGDSDDFHLHIDINTGSHTGGNAIRADTANLVNPEKLYFSKRFRYGLVASTATLATNYVFNPDWYE